MNVDDVGHMIVYHGPTSASTLHSTTILSVYGNLTGCSTAFWHRCLLLFATQYYRARFRG